MSNGNLTRRRVLQLAGGASAMAAFPAIGGTARARFVVIGGGFGGAAAAKALRAGMPDAAIVLLTDQPRFWMCPGSNAVVAGMDELASVEVGYDAIRAHDIDVRLDPAVAVDAERRRVRTASGAELPYDKLIMSPGVSMDYSDMEGISEKTVERVPHAWKAGPQTELLARQLAAMPEDGLFVLSMPRAPYRCPPAPAERACLVAHYMRQHKPKAKLLVLDGKDEFSFQDLFMEAWDALYSDIIEYRSIADDGLIRGVDPETLTAYTDFDEIAADVLNVIPPQKAGRIAISSGAADETGWCPVDLKTFHSQLLPDVFVIGDSALGDPLPKAGSTAASQARVAADAAIAELKGEAPPVPSWFASCYSLAAPDYGIRLGATYAWEDEHVIRSGTDFSELGADADSRLADARYTGVWLEQIKLEIWG